MGPSEGGSAAPQLETRRANERFERAIGHVVEAEKHVPFLCECMDALCTEPVPMTVEEYKAVRAHPRRFALVPGHPTIAGELIISEDLRFQVSEKPE